jgi:hypothetical protein
LNFLDQLTGMMPRKVRLSKFQRGCLVDSPAAPDALLAHGVSPMLHDRLPGNRQYCLDKAVECDRKAAQARDPNAAKEFQSLAARWRVAAATRDFNHKVEDILRTLRAAASS